MATEYQSTGAHNRFLWNRRGGAPSRKELLDKIFSDEEYKKWYINFHMPEERKTGKVSSEARGLSRKSRFSNVYLYPFRLYADREMKCFYILPKIDKYKRNEQDMVDGFYVMLKSTEDTPGSYGEYKKCIVNVTPSMIKELFPKLSKSVIEKYTENHPMSMIELRLKLGEYNNMIDDSGDKTQFLIEKVTRTRRMTTGKLIGRFM